MYTRDAYANEDISLVSWLVELSRYMYSSSVLPGLAEHNNYLLSGQALRSFSDCASRRPSATIFSLPSIKMKTVKFPLLCFEHIQNVEQ